MDLTILLSVLLAMFGDGPSAALPEVVTPPKQSALDICDAGSTARIAVVKVQFDIAPDGVPIHVEAIEADDTCYADAAVAAVESWRYPPLSAAGDGAQREGIVMRFEFEPDNYVIAK